MGIRDPRKVCHLVHIVPEVRKNLELVHETEALSHVHRARKQKCFDQPTWMHTQGGTIQK